MQRQQADRDRQIVATLYSRFPACRSLLAAAAIAVISLIKLKLINVLLLGCKGIMLLPDAS